MKKILLILILTPLISFAENRFTNSVGQEFVLIKPGSFSMGSKRNFNEKPVVYVTISKHFYIQTTEVTQGQWYLVMKNKPWLKVTQKSHKNYPAIWVSWYDAKEFIKRLNKKEKKKKLMYRLPYEAEWEYACRSGSSAKYSYGNDVKILKEYAWYDEIGIFTTDLKNPKYKKVGLKKSNVWGLFDMHGNVSEWCEDWYSIYNLKKSLNPRGSVVGFKKIQRGGGWVHDDFRCSSTYRFISEPINKSISTGFRLVLAEYSPPKKVKKIKVIEKKQTKKHPDTFTNSIGQKFKYIKPGSFTMGREKGFDKDIVDETKHKVVLTKGFYIQESEVTQEQWYRVMKSRPWRFKRKKVNEGKTFPAVYISWFSAKEFINKLNKLEKSNKYRLPTEAEWEYTIKAGSKSHIIPDKRNYGWFNTPPMKKVKLKAPNKWGIYDIVGNAYEWCEDWYYYYPKQETVDPKGAPEAPDGYCCKVIRGSGYTMANRSYGNPYSSSDKIGFRLVRSE